MLSRTKSTIERTRTNMKFGLLYEMQRPHTGFDVDYNMLIEETL